MTLGRLLTLLTTLLGGNPVKKKLLKNLAALAIGGFISGASTALLDPEHFGDSLKALAKAGAAGAGIAVVSLNIKSPREQ